MGGQTSGGSTAAPPTLATSVGSSPGLSFGGAGLGQGHASAGSTATVTLPAFTPKDAAGRADPFLGKGPGGSVSRTEALPTYAATPNPLLYKGSGTS